MYMYVYIHLHICVYMCMCICMYIFTCVSVYMYAYTCIFTRVWVSYRRILFICTVQSLYYMRVYHKDFFYASMRVCLGIGSRFFFQLVHGKRSVLLLAWETMF